MQRLTKPAGSAQKVSHVKERAAAGVSWRAIIRYDETARCHELRTKVITWDQGARQQEGHVRQGATTNGNRGDPTIAGLLLRERTR